MRPRPCARCWRSGPRSRSGSSRPARAARAATARWRSTRSPRMRCSPSSQLLHDAGARFTVVSEERGTVDFGGDGVLVVVDPIDGSLNAKRGLPHHCVSIAVAEGPTMADVVFGFVQDFGPDEEWVATRGGGATLNGVRARPGASASGAGRPTASSSSSASSPPTRAGCCSRPRGSSQVAHRLRAIGTIAAALCQVAAGAVRRDADAEGLPRGRRRRGPADRARGGRPGRVHRVRRPARRAARPAAALAGGGRALGGRAGRAGGRASTGTGDRLEPRRAGGARDRQPAARG